MNEDRFYFWVNYPFNISRKHHLTFFESVKDSIYILHSIPVAFWTSRTKQLLLLNFIYLFIFMVSKPAGFFETVYS